ncbi:band 7 domain-containing protein [Phellopilus nigrolimitatus]|nr:band 7 domain-containing protein [Phellopilus nigrolimitatus]
MSIADNTTVVEGCSDASEKGTGSRAAHVSKASRERAPRRAPVLDTFTRATDIFAEDRPFFVIIGKEGVLAALKKLDSQLTAAGRDKILSSKTPTDWIGRQVSPGELGLINHGGLPKLLVKPGRYPGSPLRNWWARKWNGTQGISDTVIEHLGLTIVQVSQNQAAVVSDPHNAILVVRHGGFAALAAAGAYRVLAVVDQTHLAHAVTDRVTRATLGWTQEVRMTSNTGAGRRQEYVVALFLNVPASNCAILQRGDDLELLPAGQHYITDASVTLRGLFTLGENQIEMPTKDIFTRDQVPVSLTIYLKWQLIEPMKLATHGYSTPYDALRQVTDKAQSVLTQIVAHLDYSSMVKQRSLGPDSMDSGGDDASSSSSAFIDALRTRAMDDLHLAALEYGIVLKDLAVIDRQFKGEIAATMDKLTTRALQAQVEAANVDRENSNKVKKEEGAFSVAKIKSQALNTQADADAYKVVAAARAAAQATQIAAEAEAEATRLAARAEAEAVRSRAAADAGVQEPFAREVLLRRVDVQRVAAYGDRAVFVPVGAGGGGANLAEQAGNALVTGFAAGLGAEKVQQR